MSIYSTRFWYVMDVSLYSEPVAARPRRRYSNEYKRQVVEASFQANTSIAAVAQAHQINANLLHTWRWQYRKGVNARTFTKL